MSVLRIGGVGRVIFFLLLAGLILPGSVSLVSGQTKDAGKDAKKEPPPPAKVLINLKCDRESATYKVDEPAVFLFASSASGDLDYKFTDDGMKVVDEGKLRVVAGKTYKLEGKLGHPGFLRLQLNQDTGTAVAAAAIDPTKIVP